MRFWPVHFSFRRQVRAPLCAITAFIAAGVGFFLSASVIGQTTRPTGADGKQGAAQPTTAAAQVNPSAASIEQQPLRRDAQRPSRARDTQPSRTSGRSGLDVQRVLMALGIVVGLIVILRLVMRWLFPGMAVSRSSSAIRVLSRSVIAPKQQVLLVHVGKRVIVVGDSGSQLSSLAQIDQQDEVAALLAQLEAEKRPAASAFGPLFGRAKEQFEDAEAKSVGLSSEHPVDSVIGSSTEAGSGADVEKRGPGSSAPTELGYAAASNELRGLTERVRQLARQFRRS